jgi:hypothetical protein
LVKKMKCISASISLFIMAFSIAFLYGCGCSPDASDLIPKDDLPEGITFVDSADTTDCGSYSGTIGETATSFSQAIYDCGQPGDAYVLVVECKNEEAAASMLDFLDNDVLDNSVYSKTQADISGNAAIEAFTSSPQEYVFLWQKDNFVFLVQGSSRDEAFNLAISIE